MMVIPSDWENHPDPQVRAFIKMAAWMLNESNDDKETEVLRSN